MSPLTPKEIAADVIDCWKAGASIAHLHMRDDEGKGTMDNSDIVLNLTTSGDLNATEETRIIHLIELKPEMASFDCGSMNWMHGGLFLDPPVFLEKLAVVMKENGVKPEIEVFDAGMLYNAMYYVKKGFLDVPLNIQFVLGSVGGTAATVENLVYLKSLLPKGFTWSALGIGKGHLPVLFSALALGGHVRVGMENNVLYTRKRLAESNTEFVERTARIITEVNKTPATL